MSGSLVVENCSVVTMNTTREEFGRGYVVVEDGMISAGGAVPSPPAEGARWVDDSWCVATLGLVNCHHHLYQWATRGMAADSTLFEWLVELYPVWAGLDEEIEYAAVRAKLLARSKGVGR